MWSLFFSAQKEVTQKARDDQEFRTGFIVQGDASRYDAPNIDEAKVENVEYLPVDAAHERATPSPCGRGWRSHSMPVNDCGAMKAAPIV